MSLSQGYKVVFCLAFLVLGILFMEIEHVSLNFLTLGMV